MYYGATRRNSALAGTVMNHTIDISSGGVVHIYTVGRSATAVVNGPFEIFSKVNGQAPTFLGCFEPKILAIKLARASSMQCCNKIFWSRL